MLGLNKNKIRVAVLLASTSIVPASLCAVGMNEAIQSAVKTNPDVLAKQSEKKSTEFRIDQEKGSYFPKIDVQAGAGWEKTRQNFKANKLNGAVKGSVGPKDRYDPQFTITQKLFDGFETCNRVAKARKETIQSQKNVEESMILRAYDAADAYITVRRFQRLVALAKENVAVHKDILSKTKALVDAGKATASDLHSVEARLSDAQAAVDDINGDYETSKANFIEVTGLEPTKLDKVTVDKKMLPATLDEALAAARENNRSVIVAKATVDVANSDFEITKAPLMPALDFQVNGRRNHDVGGKNGHETNLTGLFQARFNVFNGGRDIAKTREFRERIAASKHRTEGEVRRAEKEVRVSFAAYNSAKNQSKYLRQAVEDKTKVQDVYREQFAAGKRSYAELLDASHEKFLAKGSLITSDATQDLSALRLLAAMGKLLDHYG